MGRQGVPGTKAPYEPQCYIASGGLERKLYSCPLAGHAPTLRRAGREKHGRETSSCLFVEFHFPECEMSFPPTSHNMALFCLIRYKGLLVSMSSDAEQRGETGHCFHSVCPFRVPRTEAQVQTRQDSWRGLLPSQASLVLWGPGRKRRS